jgi:hypothetical protein
MKLPNSRYLLLPAAFVLCLAAAFGLHYLAPVKTTVKKVKTLPPPVSLSTTGTADTGTPAFTSASFNGGDPFRSLGPEWTFLRQSDLTEKDGKWLAGTVPVREAVVKLIGKDVTMLLTELRITETAKLLQARSSGNVKKAKVAGRDGYMVPMQDMAGGTAFAIVGQNRVLLIQHGESYLWPTGIEPEIANYIVSVDVP